MFKRKCKITFIAHGATIHSDENRFSDKDNYPPLTDAGEEEIEKICSWLEERGIKSDKIYASSSSRTIQSAELISNVLKSDFEVLECLKPRNYGKWGGLTCYDVEEKYPQTLTKLHENPCLVSPDGGEELSDFNKRVKKAIKKIVEENVGNRIIIVTYPEIIRSAVASAIGLPAKKQSKIYIKTGSATQISYFDTWASLVYSGCVPL